MITEELITWLKVSADKVKYGDITLRITCHDGPVYLERTINMKEKINENEEEII